MQKAKIISAYMMLISGIVLAFLSFLISANNDVSDNILWYVAQTIIYAGSIFGVSSYIEIEMNRKFKQFKKNETN